MLRMIRDDCASVRPPSSPPPQLDYHNPAHDKEVARRWRRLRVRRAIDILADLLLLLILMALLLIWRFHGTLMRLLSE